MSFQLVHFENNELKGFLAAIGVVRARQREVGLGFRESHLDRFGQQGDVFMGALNIVERSLGAVAHFFTPP